MTTDEYVEPEPCRDCMTPIYPGEGWCADCEHEREAEALERYYELVTPEQYRQEQQMKAEYFNFYHDLPGKELF